MNKIWSDDAWEDYVGWQTEDKKTLKRINLLLKDVERLIRLTESGSQNRSRASSAGFGAGELTKRIGWSIALFQTVWKFFPARDTMNRRAL